MSAGTGGKRIVESAPAGLAVTLGLIAGGVMATETALYCEFCFDY